MCMTYINKLIQVLKGIQNQTDLNLNETQGSLEVSPLGVVSGQAPVGALHSETRNWRRTSVDCCSQTAEESDWGTKRERDRKRERERKKRERAQEKEERVNTTNH